jgi:hypothetical protein
MGINSRNLVLMSKFSLLMLADLLQKKWQHLDSAVNLPCMLLAGSAVLYLHFLA